jgi:hypothetical protein
LKSNNSFPVNECSSTCRRSRRRGNLQPATWNTICSATWNYLFFSGLKRYSSPLTLIS